MARVCPEATRWSARRGVQPQHVGDVIGEVVALVVAREASRRARRSRTPRQPRRRRLQRWRSGARTSARRDPRGRAGRGSTSTWPSHAAPAPMPIVGTETARSPVVRPRRARPRARSRSSRRPRAPWRRPRALERPRPSCALHLEATHHVHRLRREADVAHHRDLGVDDRLDHRHPLAAAFELHGLRAGSDERRRVAHRVVDRHVVAHPRQVTDDERVRLASARRRRRGGPCRRS